MLHEEIQKFYATADLQIVYFPHLGMACCVCIDDTWYRARVNAHRPGSVVEVFLVDVGKYYDVEWGQLRRLDDQFIDVPESVTECALIDIAPKNFAKNWGADVTTELKRLCKHKLKAVVWGCKSRVAKIELYIVKSKVQHLINAYLAKHNLVEWNADHKPVVEHAASGTDIDVSNESARSNVMPNEVPQKEFRQLIKIVEIVSPSEFYVTPVKYENGIRKMHTEIQNTMATYAPGDDSLKWVKGDDCFVFAKLPNDSTGSWYRGRIETNVQDAHFTVLLRDHRQLVSAKPSELAPASPSLCLVVDGVLKCHLENVKPTSTEWANAAKDEFKYMTKEEFDTFSISACGEKTQNSLPVYLWGRKKPIRDDALGASLVWTNINKVFAARGYADSDQRFKTIADCDPIENYYKEMVDFNVWCEGLVRTVDQLLVKNSSSIDTGDNDVLLERELDPDHPHFSFKKVVAWMPATPIELYSFSAIPTYVDNNAVIHLHEHTRSNYLKHIMLAINKVVEKQKPDRPRKWKINEPCMVKYHLDECFYRGQVKDVLSNGRYRVSWTL